MVPQPVEEAEEPAHRAEQPTGAAAAGKMGSLAAAGTELGQAAVLQSLAVAAVEGRAYPAGRREPQGSEATAAAAVAW